MSAEKIKDGNALTVKLIDSFFAYSVICLVEHK